jgi:CheY-like chemotaxis protein
LLEEWATTINPGVAEMTIGTGMCSNKKFPTNLQSLQGLRVLVVDDNVDLCELLAVLLQPYGVQVQTAFLTQQALKIFVEWQPDVLVSDIALPKEDGYSLIQQVRTKTGEQGKVVLAIAVTDYINERMLQRALCVGFDLWFTKPLDFDEFVVMLACLAMTQLVLAHASRHGELSLEKQLELEFQS